MKTFKTIQKPNPLTNKIKSLLFHDYYLPPQLYFALVLFQQIGLFQVPFSLQCLFYLGLLLLLLSYFSHFLFNSAALNNNLATLMPFNILIGLLGCNQKWKFLIFCFSLMFYLPTPHTQLKQLFIIVISAYICISTFFTFVFPTPMQNMWFFCGFFALFFLHSSSYVLKYSFQLQIDLISKLFILLVTVLFAYGMIKMKFESIVLKPNRQDQCPGQIVHKMNLLKKQLKIQKNISTFLYVHKQSCTNLMCFCTKYNKQQIYHQDITKHKSIPIQIINSFFLQSFQSKSWQKSERFELMHHYTQFLIENGQLVNSFQVLCLINQRELQYFGKCNHFRIQKKIEQKLSTNIYFDNLDQKLLLIYNFDLWLGYINKEIRQIIKDKVEFWKELCKQTPLLSKVQKQGRNLVLRIESLHKNFMFKMRPCQEQLETFKCSYIYSSYLLLTTNYLQFANSLFKKTNKIVQQKKGHFDNQNQYAIFLEIVQNVKNDNNKKQFQLIIKSISSSLCALLQKQKSSIIHQNITQIIPLQFRFIHDLSFNNYVNSSNFQASKSALIGQTVELPFRINDSKVIFLSVSSQLRFDPVNNRTLIQCMLKQQKTNKTVNFIANLNGQVVYRQNQHFKDFPHQQEIKNCIETMRVRYERDSLVENVKKQFFEEDNIIKVTYSPMFYHKFISNGIEPLLKIEIQDDNFKNQKIFAIQYDTTKVNDELNFDKIHNETDSQASTTSRKDSISNVLTNLTESNSIKKQPFLTLILTSIAVASILSFSITKDYFEIWDANTKENTPTFTIMNMVMIKTVFNLALNQVYDFQRDYHDPAIKQRMSWALYGGQSIQSFVFNRYSSFIKMLRGFYFGGFLSFNNEVSRKAKQLLQKQFLVQNKQLPDIPSQNMTLQSMIINMISGIYFAQHGKEAKQLILSYAYLPIFYKEFTEVISVVRGDIDEKFQNLKQTNIIIIAFINIILVVLTSLLLKFNWKSKKEFLKIYNLFACLDAKIIANEIARLQKIESGIFAKSHQYKQFETSNKILSFTATNKIVEESRPHKQLNQSNKLNDQQKMLKSYKKTNDVKIRKRAADLDINGSDCDRKTFLLKDLIPVLFIIVFMITFNGLFIQKYKHIKKVKAEFIKSYEILNFVENSGVALTNTKIYMDDYQQSNKVQVFGEDLENWLKNWLMLFQNKSGFYLQLQNQIIECAMKSFICKSPFSLRLFQGIVKKSISDGYQSKRALLKQNSTQNRLALEKTRLALRYTTYILQQVGKGYISWLVADFQRQEIDEVSYKGQKSLMSIVFWIIFSIYVVCCVLYIMFRKEKFVIEVTLLSILSKQMLYNNKSIQSFVQKLSKNLR